MPSGVSYDYAALRYLDQWCETEASLHAGLASRTRSHRLTALTAAAAFFRIARTIPKQPEIDAGVERYALIDEAFKELPAPRAVTPASVDRVVTQFASAVGSRYDASLLSAASKILWLVFRDPVVIYDSNVRTALGVGAGDYAAYRHEWEARYAADLDDIRDACRQLPRMRRYAAGAAAMSAAEVASLVESPWFQRRVLDIKLWKDGGRKGQATGQPARTYSS